MEVRFLPAPAAAKRMTTEELRTHFVFDRLCMPGAVTSVYCDADRSIVGFAVPTAGTVTLAASRKEMAADHFLERREIGIVNIGGAGTVRADAREFALGKRDLLYLGRGTKDVTFHSAAANAPASWTASFGSTFDRQNSGGPRPSRQPLR